MEYRFSTTIANIALDLNHLDTIYRILNVRELPLPDYIDTSDKEVIIKHIRNVFKAYQNSEKLKGNTIKRGSISLKLKTQAWGIARNVEVLIQP